MLAKGVLLDDTVPDEPLEKEPFEEVPAADVLEVEDVDVKEIGVLKSSVVEARACHCREYSQYIGKKTSYAFDIPGRGRKQTHSRQCFQVPSTSLRK